MQELHERYTSDRGVEVIAIHVDDENYGNYDSAQALFDDRGFTFPVIEKGGAIAEAFGVTSIPLTVIIDQDGRLAGRHSGRMTEDDREELEREIESLRAAP